MFRLQDELCIKNRDLHRRAQAADAAVVDAKRCFDKLAKGLKKGTPWCDGSLGRGLLAWEVENQAKKIAELKAIVDRLPKDALTLRKLQTLMIVEADYNAAAMFLELVDAVEDKQHKGKT